IFITQWLERIPKWKPIRVEFRRLSYGQDSFDFLVQVSDIVEMLQFDTLRTHTDVGPSDLDEYLVQVRERNLILELLSFHRY
ncbi:hypothetical protein PENTCL1PPCAC_18820, partial [Pristionchus entomophagus]